MDEQTNGHTPELSVSRLELLFIFRAYNRKEISLEECLQRSREWAEAMMWQHDTINKDELSSLQSDTNGHA